MNRFRDPGAGAFSYHTGRQFFVDRDVKAGEELFLNYGHCQREGSSDSADWSTTIPMVEDYHMAAKILWEALTKPGAHSVPKNVNKYVTALLHSSARDELMAVLKSGKVKSHRDFVPFVAKHLATTPRTPEWVKSNGMCLEHLLAGKSQIPQAGQGAIVQHTVRKGEIVVPVPLLQVVDKEALDMHDDDGNLEGSQLLVNYCFGHPESSMLLCPDTNASTYQPLQRSQKRVWVTWTQCRIPMEHRLGALVRKVAQNDHRRNCRGTCTRRIHGNCCIT